MKVILNDRIDCFPIHIVFICLSSTNLSSICLPSSCNHLVACHHHACHHDVSISLLVINMLAIIRLSSNCASSSCYHPIACTHHIIIRLLVIILLSPQSICLPPWFLLLCRFRLQQCNWLGWAEGAVMMVSDNNDDDDDVSETPLMRERLLRKLWFALKINVNLTIANEVG